MSEARKIEVATPAVIEAEFMVVEAFLAEVHLRKSAEIADYPIGSKEHCLLEVENKGGEFRLMRTTTDARGRCCKPITTAYVAGVAAVAVSRKDPTNIFWVVFGPDGIYTKYANFALRHKLVYAPCFPKPNRTERRYGVVTGVGISKHEVHVIPADPPELCEAFDTWEVLLKKAQARVLAELAA